MNKILFVCLGNICRSPAAEGAFVQLLKENGLFENFYVDSAGTSSFHAGERADSRMREVALKRGFDLPSWSRQVSLEDFDEFDLLIAMDRKNLSDLRSMCDDLDKLKKLRIFTDFKRESTHEEVPDPYYGGERGFEEVMDLVTECSKGLLEYLRVNMVNI